MGKVQARKNIDAKTSSQHHYRFCVRVCSVSIYIWSAIVIVAIVIVKNILRQPPSQRNAIRHLRKRPRQQQEQQHMTVISKVVHAGIEYYMYVRATADDNQAKSAWIESTHAHVQLSRVDTWEIRNEREFALGK